MIKKLINIFILSAIVFLIYSCEDDALLTPKTDEECLEGPSYCNLSMPNDNIALLAHNPKKY